MIPGEPALQMRIFLGEHDRWKGVPLHVALLEKLRREGFAGATVYRAIAGFGGHSVVHAARLLDVSQDLPIVLEATDAEAKIRAALPELKAMVGAGLITLTPVEVAHYSSGPKPHGHHAG